MQKRYTIIRSYGYADINEQILPSDISECDAIKNAETDWYSLAKEDQRTTTIELALIAYDEDSDELVLEVRDCPDGWDCLSAYNPIVSFSYKDGRGGKREGSGRKPSGLPPKETWSVKVTEEEKEALKEYLKKIRER